MYTLVNMTQDSLRALHNCICLAGLHIEEGTYMASELQIAHKACAAMANEIYEVWTDLPDGTPLKEIYRDEVWHPEPNDPTNQHDTKTRRSECTQSADLPDSGEGGVSANKQPRRAPRRKAE